MRHFVRTFALVALLVGGMSAAMAGCPPPPPMQCTSAPTGGASNLGAYDDPNITNSNGFNTYVSNNEWGAQSGTTATICAPADENGPSTPVSLSTKTTQDQGGAVQTYPDIQQLTNNYGNGSQDLSIDGSTSIKSTYITSNPDRAANNATWEAAYDIWVDTPNIDEIMVWTTTSTARLANNGGVKHIDHLTFGGVDYSYWSYGGGLPFMVRNDQQAGGTVDIRAILKWMEAHNIDGATPTSTKPAIVKAGSTLGQIDFGWEICSTNGATLAFGINGYSLTVT